jgi:plasmid stabilization system protein ParE
MGAAHLVKLRYTLPALADLSSILDYITTHSPRDSRRVHARIQVIVDLLLLYPDIGSRTDDPTIRRMTASPYPYLIFYEATDAEIIIHAVRHAARDPSGMPGTA